MNANIPTKASAAWSPDNWLRFWSNPSAALAAERVPTVVAPDVFGVWPRSAEPVRGVTQYTQRIVDLLTLVPDLRLSLGERASDGAFVFLRWTARGTSPDGQSFEGIGVDRVRLRDGLVTENLIMSDLPIFEHLTRFASRAT